MRPSWLLLLLSVTGLGCGDGLTKFPTAKVTGQVVCKGDPVADLRVYFRPLAGKEQIETGRVGDGSTRDDGTFTISTYGKGDGAVVGKHAVIVDGPHPEDFRDFTCECETHSNRIVQEVEVKSTGTNNFVIELKPKTAKSPPSINPRDLEDIKAAEAASVSKGQ